MVTKQPLVVMLGSLALSLIAAASFAQSTQLNLPLDSQAATVTQRIGITDITISYHRPMVNRRKIWGNIVPYGMVWRAGANQNTTIRFTDPVTIEGQSLDKGTYGLHMIPGQDQWIVIFSRAYASWGSFTYKESEDALRVTVKPQAAEMEEALSYSFDPLSPNSAVVTMRWEKLAVPFKVGVNVDDIVQRSLQTQLRGLAQYTWEGWDDAANYLLAHKLNLDDALQYEDQSLQVEERFDNLMTRSRILGAMGKQEEAKADLNKALAKATPQQLHGYAFQLLAQKKPQEAWDIWKSNARNHPELWFTHAGMARVYSAQGDFDSALKEEKIAEAGAPDGVKPLVQRQIKRLEAKEDINQ